MTLTTSLVLALLALPAADANTGPVLLDFHASWCGPCRQMEPVVARLAEKRYHIQSVDIDQSPKLAARYHVSEVPTFVIVAADGHELARTKGVQSAAELAGLYNQAADQLRAARTDTAPPSDTSEAPAAAAENTPEASAVPRAPQPWETTVRIKIYGSNTIGFGSGTIIYSTAKESIILTCAHIFHIDGVRDQPRPAQFRRKILVDLFDGQLHGRNPAMVHPLEADVPGQAVDYDVAADVGLIRIQPGRKLKASPVVAANWQPRQGQRMHTVGCSEGHDATAWTTHITNAGFRGQIDSRLFDGIECEYAPKLGRSGGGLYTDDGFVAGVCDFAEPHGQHGLYASPRSIQRILDKNKLTICYNPAATKGPETLLADTGRPARAAAASTGTKYRAQDSVLPIPDPDRVGVRLDPVAPSGASSRATAVAAAPTGGWHNAGGASRRASEPDNNTLIAEAPRPQRVSQPVNPAAAPSLPASSSGVAGDLLPDPDSARIPARPGGGWKAVRSSATVR